MPQSRQKADSPEVQADKFYSRFWAAMNSAAADKNLTDGEFRLFFVMISRSGLNSPKGNGKCWQSLDTLAQQSASSRRRITAASRQLVNKGYLKVNAKLGIGNEYYPCFPETGIPNITLAKNDQTTLVINDQTTLAENDQQINKRNYQKRINKQEEGGLASSQLLDGEQTIKNEGETKIKGGNKVLTAPPGAALPSVTLSPFLFELTTSLTGRGMNRKNAALLAEKLLTQFGGDIDAVGRYVSGWVDYLAIYPPKKNYAGLLYRVLSDFQEVPELNRARSAALAGGAGAGAGDWINRQVGAVANVINLETARAVAAPVVNEPEPLEDTPAVMVAAEPSQVAADNLLAFPAIPAPAGAVGKPEKYIPAWSPNYQNALARLKKELAAAYSSYSSRGNFCVSHARLTSDEFTLVVTFAGNFYPADIEQDCLSWLGIIRRDIPELKRLHFTNDTIGYEAVKGMVGQELQSVGG